MNLSGNNIDFLAAFLGGMAVSFTPCVYPLIPVVIGVVTARSFGSKLKGFILSLVFVSGTAITYATLGFIAALTGKYFGRVSAQPLSYFFVGGAVLIFSLFMLEIIKIPLPSFFIKAPQHKNGFAAVFFMGLVSGLAVGPCTAPALGVILTHASEKQDYLHAALLLMSFAYGMGLLLILSGTFSSLLANIPKPGAWMVKIKKALGIVLIIWALYFIYLGLRRM